MLTAEQIRKACKGAPNASNLNSYTVALDTYGARIGLDQIHRAVELTAQVLHESGEFRYDREIWGPTAAQKKYDTRADLGNTPEVDGDGKLRAGRGPLQVTGGTNERDYTQWARAKIDPNAPDFYANPDLINTDPWEGLSALWYWDSRNLNRYADSGDVEMITRKINGGLNGYADRLEYLDRLSLVVLGYAPTDIKGFQKAAGIAVDGLSGPRTRAAMHSALLALTKPLALSADAQTAPVVTDEKPTVPEAVPAAVNTQTRNWGFGGIGLGGVGTLLTAVSGFDWRIIALFAGIALVGAIVWLVIGPLIVRRIKQIRAEIAS